MTEAEARDLVRRLRAQGMSAAFTYDDDLYQPPNAELCDEAADFIESALSLRGEVIEALEACAAKFREYEKLHHAKLADINSPAAMDAVMEKVLRNREMAEMCEAALANQESGNG